MSRWKISNNEIYGGENWIFVLRIFVLGGWEGASYEHYLLKIANKNMNTKIMELLLIDFYKIKINIL